MTKYSVIGKPVSRVDALGKVTGEAKYTADLSLPGMLYGKILRSPYAHARILNIDTSRAEKLTGVKAVVTGKEILPYKFGVFKKTADQYLLAIDKVRYVGEEVAGVAAVDEDVAEEALNLIRVDYEVLPFVLDPLAAVEEGAPQVHDYAERNMGVHGVVQFGDVDRAFQEADRVYEDRFIHHKISHGQMEPYAVLAHFEAGKMHIWAPNQSPFVRRRALSNALGMPLNKVRVHHVHIGGTFGGRSDTYPPEFIAALLSIKTKRPVRIVLSREETMMATRHKHATVIDLKMAVKRDGTILGKDIRLLLDGGAYMSSGVIATYNPIVHSEHIYRIPNYRYEGIRAYTNKTVCSMQRIMGNQLDSAEEMMLERIADDLGLDSIQWRIDHAIVANEVLPSGSKVTSYALRECIEKVVEVSAYREKRGKLPFGRGVGIGCGGSFAGFSLGFRGNSSAMIKFNEDGSCTLFTGNIDTGQGNDSMHTQIAAEVMGIPMEDIAIVSSDSELTPQDPGNYPMLSAFCSGNAVRLAAADARDQIIQLAAGEMGVSPGDLDIKERQVFLRSDPSKTMSVGRAVQASMLKGVTVMGRGAYTPKAHSEFGWADRSTGKFKGQYGATHTAGANAAEVEVDLETGVVKVINLWQAYDCGFALNPVAVEGQWEGLAVQAMGEALHEKLVWDKRDGRLITDCFLDYRMPCSLDTPKIHPIIVESIDPDGPFGAKEAGLCGGPGLEAAIVNAIYDAVGIVVKDLPVTPEAVLQALEDKGVNSRVGSKASPAA